MLKPTCDFPSLLAAPCPKWGESTISTIHDKVRDAPATYRTPCNKRCTALPVPQSSHLQQKLLLNTPSVFRLNPHLWVKIPTVDVLPHVCSAGMTIPLRSTEYKTRSSGVPPNGVLSLSAQGSNLYEVEKNLIHQALIKAGGNQTQASRLLSITCDTLRYKMKKYEPERYRGNSNSA